MIDFQDGSVKFEDGFSAVLGLNKSKFIINSVSAGGGNLGEILPLGEHVSESFRWGVGGVFENSCLRQLWLQCLNPPGVLSGIADLANEMARRDFHDKWLMEFLRKYSVKGKKNGAASYEAQMAWGKIASVLDMRGVQAIILLDYKF